VGTADVGAALGCPLPTVGSSVVGLSVVGIPVGLSVGNAVGLVVGVNVGTTVGIPVVGAVLG
jgi:hypothetical protein